MKSSLFSLGLASASMVECNYSYHSCDRHVCLHAFYLSFFTLAQFEAWKWHIKKCKKLQQTNLGLYRINQYWRVFCVLEGVFSMWESVFGIGKVFLVNVKFSLNKLCTI